MATRSTYQPITVADWLTLSTNEGVTKRLAVDPYSVAYGSLRPHFEKLTAVSWDDAVVGLHIVYGWMPTIPKLGEIMRWDQQQKTVLTAILTRAITGNVPTDAELVELMAFSNNSMIGASKLMHFLNPSLFPIWDSRTAQAFLNRPKVYAQEVNKVEKWKSYQATLTSWVPDQRVKARCGELRKMAGHLAGVTDLRLVELVLFHKTASKRKAKKK